MEEEDERIQQTAMEVKLKREKIEGILRERENAIQKVYIILSHVHVHTHTHYIQHTLKMYTHNTFHTMYVYRPPAIHTCTVCTPHIHTNSDTKCCS